MANSFEQLSSMLLRRQSWGPFLVAVGAYSFFVLINRDQTKISILTYVGAGIAAILTIAGISMMFLQVRGEEAIAESTDLPLGTGSIEHAVTQLSKNYEILRRQTTQGFILAGTFMGLGILVILSGSVGKLFGLVTGGSNLASIAGVILEFISGTSLLIYRLNFKRLNETSDRLDSTWRILAAHRLADSLPEEKKAEATMRLIEAMIMSPIPVLRSHDGTVETTSGQKVLGAGTNT